VTRPRLSLFHLALLVPMLLTAGCSTTPPPRLYVLGDPVNPTSAVIPQSGRPVVRLFRVTVPDYLDSRDILRRGGPNEVKASSSGLWAERLSVGVTHALTASLTRQLPRDVVVADRPITPPSRQILVDVTDFEIGPDGKCLLTAHWTLSDGEDRVIMRQESDSFVEQSADGSDASAAAYMSRAIDRLALRIAGATIEADRGGNAPPLPARASRDQMISGHLRREAKTSMPEGG
jgi:uncharacterized lipoprotein YmbA